MLQSFQHGDIRVIFSGKWPHPGALITLCLYLPTITPRHSWASMEKSKRKESLGEIQNENYPKEEEEKGSFSAIYWWIHTRYFKCISA